MEKILQAITAYQAVHPVQSTLIFFFIFIGLVDRENVWIVLVFAAIFVYLLSGGT